MNLVWDGAPYNRSQIVQDAAKELEINLQPLSAYSHDFMPFEHLWQWLREDVTYHTCYLSQVDLIQAVSHFQHHINLDPISLADRLWVKNHLDPDEEKLKKDTQGLYKKYRNNPKPGVGSWNGHIKTYQDQRRDLNKLLDDWKRSGCGDLDRIRDVIKQPINQILEEAKYWANKPAP